MGCEPLLHFGCWIVLALVTQAACSSEDHACPRSCPAAWMLVQPLAVAGADGGAVAAVQANLTGPLAETMSCDSSGSAATCTWSPGPVNPGTYALEVSAPGFETLHTSVIVTTSRDCGCESSSLTPSSVTLTPM